MRLVVVLGTSAATVVAATTTVNATPTTPAKSRTSPVLSAGLDNPRHLGFDRRGRLYVAEAGTGGRGPCIPAPEGEGEVCFGLSGAVSRVWTGGSRRVLTGLPSLAAGDGSAAIGPSDLLLAGRRHVTLSIGLGADPRVRASMPTVGKRQLGTLTSARLHHPQRRVIADLAAFEAAANPDGSTAPDGSPAPDSDPTGFVRSHRGYVATDAGGNTLLKVSSRGKVSTLAVFPTRLVPSPFGGPDIDMQAVPTSVVKGSDGAYYVSQLTGFPFPASGASIFRVVPGRAPTVYASGLTNVTDLAWHHGKLYAVQISDVGLAAEPPDALPTGSLVRVTRGSHAPTTVAGGLPAPYGVAIRGGSAYVTTCSVCPDGGGVTRVRLH